ncbi:MAG TPA: hypothetical protein VE978_21845 [Chitinophagales bacterium]|nr:hypothetical protein [Chitinophagales bacterium]
MEQLYLPVKEIHNILRWVVLALAVITIVKYFMGWMSKSSFKSLDNRLSLFYVSSLDLQFLIGLLLYFFLSPLTHPGNVDMDNANSRFFAIEHPATMLLGIIFAHVGRVASKKATTDTTRFKRGAIWFILSLIMILARMPWA